ncbi:unnamed protein product [Closterium sp. Naga37s-1]|nr:unnamed protein product [Closterium sp. Naga37s-1]
MRSCLIRTPPPCVPPCLPALPPASLPDAPEMEIFCAYGTGLLTERAYVYRLSPSNDTCLIPFRIDASANGPPGQVGTTWDRWVQWGTGGCNVGQVGAMWDRWVQCGTGGCNVGQVGAMWDRWVQCGTDGCNVGQMGAMWDRWLQCGTDGRHVGQAGDCLTEGAYFTDGDETAPVLSMGLPCAKLWRGRTRFNPAASPTFLREYEHRPTSGLLAGRSTQSGSHVDIMGNFALIEDILRVAAGATGAEIGGDQIYSDILHWAKRVGIKL